MEMNKILDITESEILNQEGISLSNDEIETATNIFITLKFLDAERSTPEF